MPGQGLVDSTACVCFVGAVLGIILVLFTRPLRPRTGTRNLCGCVASCIAHARHHVRHYETPETEDRK